MVGDLTGRVARLSPRGGCGDRGSGRSSGGGGTACRRLAIQLADVETALTRRVAAVVIERAALQQVSRHIGSPAGP